MKAVGIDLGTTFSCLAVLNDYGKPEIVPNKEGERITPSVIMFDQENQFTVGTIAKNSAVADPGNVVEFVKRQMGNADYVFVHGETEFRPEDLSALIIKKLVTDAEVLLGTELPGAVITVPAYFDDARRQATMDAGEIAGLNVLAIVNEPTAAALAYGMSNPDINQRIIVYDLGGGTFDVTILEVEEGKIRVVATDGDHMLGGKDFDDRIIMHCARKFEEEHGIDLLEDPEALQDLRQRAEAAKKALSTRQSAKVAVSAQGKRHTVELSREQFEEMTADLLGRSELLLDTVLKSAELTWNDIDQTLLVGGMTRMPAVCELVRKASGKEPTVSINPDEAVAHGAAIYAGIMLAGKGDPDIILTDAGRRLRDTKIEDVTSHSYGILLVDSATGQDINKIMIPKNSPVPAERKETYYVHEDGQRIVEMVVLQGEDSDPANCTEIGEAVLELDGPKPRNYPIEVVYKYDSNMRMDAVITDPQTGASKALQITERGRLSSAEVEEKREAMKDAEVI
ncbi:MAG TPA: Hsp70 family protein [Bacillota bacterium]|nr:Hsp70 family protein [Bacillota bacterium]HOK71371.1 Hsp70 family protein [Bacillota bacterium]HOO30626.1 Hsp70 family protein [Bacillota bacterium]HPQ02109.1 Hsp70 family protein [Bacillota bacterium]HPZ14581.1 Hsp70 family protein [Bacillota bacterium]